LVAPQQSSQATTLGGQMAISGPGPDGR